MKEIGTNVLAKRVGDKVFIEIDLTADHGATASGNKKIASVNSRFGVEIAPQVKLSLNCWESVRKANDRNTML